MLDARLIRADPEGTKAALSRRSPEAVHDVDALLGVDARRRELLTRVELSRAERNAAAKEIAEARKRGEDAAEAIAHQAELKERQTTEEDAEVLRMHGSPPEFPFKPRDHLDLAGAEGLGLIETEAAGRVSGSRFHYLLGDLVRLEFALMQWGLEKLSGKGFMPVIPPVLVKREAMVGTGFFPEAVQ